MKTIYQCQHCKSDNVEVKAWVEPNNNHAYVDEIEGDELGWCCDEKLPAVIKTVEVEDQAKVIGFQVVGDDGSPQEGEIHPDMGPSFCVYNRTQALSMLNDNNQGDKQWKLLAIWEGDVENPTMMFGDPRS